MKTSFTALKNYSKNGFSLIGLVLDSVINLIRKEPYNSSKMTKNPEDLSQKDAFHSIYISNSEIQDNTKIPLSNLTDLSMNQLSFQEDSHVRSYQIGSNFDEKTKSWIQKKTVIPTHDAPNLDKEMKKNLGFSGKNSIFYKALAISLLMLSSVLSGFSQTQTDIRIGKTVSNSMPVLNSNITYTLYAINEGAAPATNVVIRDVFPTAGATANTAGMVVPSGTTFNPSTFEWTIPTLAVGDSIAVTIPATVISRGVFFNTAEVISMSGSDIDSSPNNNSLVEDDFAATCFSVPLYWYVGDEYIVSIPAPFSYGTGIKWFRNGVEITAGSPHATVNADNSLTIKNIGSYTFTTTISTCPATGCCAIELIQGPYGSIGNYVWKDSNNDGIQNDGATAGVKDVIVELYKADSSGAPIGSAIQTVLTDASGQYLFDSLLTDRYVVKIVTTSLPDTCKLSSKIDLGGDDTQDSDFNDVSGLSPPIYINVDSTGIQKDNLTIDAALFQPTGSIGDYVWKDANNNGIQDSGESGQSGITVQLFKADSSGLPESTPFATTTTGTNGFYEFTDLKKGDYFVKIVTTSLPAGCILSDKKDLGGDDTKDSDFDALTGFSPKITLNPGDTSNPLNVNNPSIDGALFSPLGSIGDYVWKDADNDGIQDIGEIGVGDVRMELWTADASGNPIGAAPIQTVNTTPGTGAYSFNNLPAGNYVVKIDTTTLPTDCKLSKLPNAGTDDTKDSDFGANGLSQLIVLDPTDTSNPLKKDNPTIDAAIFSVGKIGDYVWKDKNNDGIQDAGEEGVGGVIMELWASDASGNPTGASPLKTTTTAAGTGFYEFTNLPKGDYVVKLDTTSLPADCKLSKKPNTGTDDTKDSDFGATGLSPKITLDPDNTGGDPLKKINPTIDAAIISVGTIGDYVWKDTDNDGIQDSGETGQSGVTMELWASDASGTPLGTSPLQTTTTNSTGFYEFKNLPKGDYVVKLITSSLPATCAISQKPNTGTDDTKDSDFNANTGLSPKITLDPDNTGGDPLKKNNPTIDAGLYTPEFDLALKKTTTATSVVAGQDVTFTIEIFNQGNIDAKDIVVTDYIPAGMELNDIDWVNNSGKATLLTPIATLAAGTSTTVDITLKVTQTTAGSITNTAEITSAKDPQDNTPTDKDSTPDNDSTNDGTAKDDVVNEDRKANPSNDEDDSDPATITVSTAPVFDLALKKTTEVTGTVKPGDNVMFVIEVLNQGTVTAKDIVVSDYIPAGFVLADTKWSGTTIATRTLAGPLAAGSSDTLRINLKVLPDATAGTLRNSAEITTAKDLDNNTPTDKDSTPDNNPANDGTAKDDVVTEDRKTNPDDDEDDSDFASVTIQPLVGTIGDYVWKDADNDGIQDVGENGVGGVTMELWTADISGNPTGTAPIQTTTTAAGTGFYQFTNLPKGDYVVKLVTSSLPTDCRISQKPNVGTDDTKDSDFNATSGLSQLISLDPNNTGGDPLKKDNPTIDAAIYSVGTIGDYVWKDTDNDGIQDAGESGVGGVTVELWASDASGNPTGTTPLQTTTTAAGTGFYTFGNLAAGDYVVKIVTSTLPAGCQLSDKKDLGGDDTKDSDFDSTTGLSPKITLDPDNTGGDPLKKNNPTIDGAIFSPLGSIGDYVWKDTDNDGIQDAGESGVGGVTVELWASDASGNPTGSTPLQTTTTTAGTGFYTFGNLAAGDYVVKIVTSTLPAGCQLSDKKDLGGDDTKDSDFNTAGLSPKVTINPLDPAQKDITTIDGAVYTPPTPVFDLALKKTITNAVVTPGQNVTFNIEVINQGEVAATNIVVTDYIPSGLILDDATWTAGSGVATKTIAGPLAAGASTTLTITFKVDNNATGSIKNIAEISSAKDPQGNTPTDKDSTPDSNSANDGIAKDDVVNEDGKNGGDEDDSDFATLVIQAQNCPIITTTVTNGNICVGDTTYIKAVASNGGAINWYLVPTGGSIIATTNSNQDYMVYPTTTATYYAEVATLPQGCPAVSRVPVIVVVNARPSTPTCTGLVEECEGVMVDLTKYIINGITTPGGAFEWRVGANPSSALVANPMSVGAGTYYLFEKSGAGCYSNPAQLRVVYKNCDKQIDLSLAKTVSPTTVNQNDNVTYTITVTNAGPDPATGVEVKDVLPAGLQFVSSSQFTNTAGTLTANVGNVNVGQTITLTFVAKVIGTGSIANFAEISKADQKDKDSTPNNGKSSGEDDGGEAVVTVNPIEPMADLSLDKTVGNATPNVGDIVVYTIKVTNSGPDKATNVEVTDVLPAGLQLVSVSGGSNSSISGNTATVTFNEILANASAQFTINAKVTGSGTIKNWAQITKSDQKDSDSTPNNGGGSTTNEDDDDDADITVSTVCNAITPIIACTNPFICVGESTTLSAIGCNGTVVWSDGQTGAMITVTPLITTSYTAQCRVSDNCISNKSNTITVVVNTSTPPVVTANVTTVCNGGKAQLSAAGCTGSIIWSDGQSGASITVSPSTTTTYTAICKKATCTSGNSNPVTITVGAAGNAPVVATSKPNICTGESSGLTATGCSGTVVWSDGQTGTAVSVSPTTTTTYTAICKVGECASPSSSGVTVTVGNGGATLTVSASKNSLCEGESATLTASGCTSTVTWSNGQSGTSITVTPTSTTTYTATCAGSNGSCGGTGSVTITITPKPVPPVVTCGSERICAGESLVFTAHNCNGTVNWNTGAVGSTMIVNPTASGTYTATCTINGCTSPASSGGAITVITETPTITASKETVCVSEPVTLTAAGCSGTLTWSTGETTNVITVTPTATTTYTVTCKVEGCEGKASKTITVGTGGTPLTITASKETICSGESVTLTASGCTSTVTWSNGQSGTSITVTPTSTTTYTATCAGSNGSCGGTGSKTITVTDRPAPPVVTCGSERICAGESLVFTAHNCNGTVNWNTGAVGSTMIVNPTASGTYTATCTINGCTSPASSGGAITVITETPTITASKETVCVSEPVTLTAAGCSGTLTWSTGETTNVITVTPTATTTYTVTCKVEGCEGKASKTITVGGSNSNPPVVSASNTNPCPGETVTLTATGCAGAVSWSTGSATTSTITITTSGTYSAKCLPAGNSCGSSDSNIVNVTFSTPVAPTITASTSQICEPGNVTLTATGCTGTVVWSNASTGSVITVNVSATSTFTATCQSGSCTSPASSPITVTVGKPAIPTISGDKGTICAGETVNMTATGCEGGTIVWSNGLTGNNITVNPTSTTNYTAVCKLPAGGCTSDASNTVTVTVTGKPDSPVITCTASRICKGDTLVLSALNCPGGTVLWSNGMTGASITIKPEQTTVYTAICKIGNCESAPSAAATITVGPPIPPVISCKLTQICAGGSTQIEAAGCTGVVRWSDGQIGAVITVSPTTLTSYSAICDGGLCQSEKSNVISVQVTGSGLKKPITKDLVNVCPFNTVDLTTGVTSAVTSQGGLFVFRTGTTPGSPAVSNPAQVGTGLYYVFEKAGNGCYSEGAPINVQITNCNGGGTGGNTNCTTNPATANAGKDTTICLQSDVLVLNGKIGGAASSARWTSDGTGSFDNSLSLTAKYTFTSADIEKGSVKFTLTTNDPDDNGACQAATSSFTAIIKAVKVKPTYETDKSPNICFGDSVKLTAKDTGFNYLWSNGATTRSITVKTPGAYSVRLIGQDGCASLSSDAITVNVGASIPAPSVNALTKNICPATTVDLTGSVTSQPVSSGGAFEYHTGEQANSPILANTNAVGAGSYYVFEKSAIGCYSAGSKITVSIDQCNVTNDTTSTDVQITIVGSRVELKIDETLEYTITVKNNGPKPATNVKIVNNLPKQQGLVVTTATPGLTAVGDSLVGTIASLAVGETKTYTYTAKLKKAGKITNVAKITSVTPTDKITSNNISQWSVECKTCQEACVGLALSADTTRQSNGSYNVTFRAIVENCGNLKLEGVEIKENLAAMFTSPATFTVIQKPTAGVGSKLITNDNFNGTTDIVLTKSAGSILEQAATDTVKFVINVVPNGNEGPFSTNATVAAMAQTIFGIPAETSDVSNDGTIVDKQSATPTVVKFYKSPSIGLALSVIDTTKKADGSYDIRFKAIVKNTGSLPLDNVVVCDTLSKTFPSPATFSVVGTTTVNSGSQLVINNDYNGTTNPCLTTSASKLAVGKADTLIYKVNVKPNGTTSFNAQSNASGTGTLASGTTETVKTVSSAGTNPDSPSKNPTSVGLGGNGNQGIQSPCIGIALFVKDTTSQVDGSYNITYNAIIKNCGNVNLKDIAVCDTLANTFTSPAVATIVNKPSLSAGSTLKVDTTYNGVSNTCMLIPAESTLAPNKVDTLKWTVNVKLNDNKGPFRNSVKVTGKTPAGQEVYDISNDGLNANPEGSTPTVINFNTLPENLIGISKEADKPIKVRDNVYDIKFTFRVKNYGKTDIQRVQVQENLAQVFGDSVKIDSVNIVSVDEGFTKDTRFTGKGNLINLLIDSTSTLPKNTTRSIVLFTRLDVSGSRRNKFENQALAIGKNGLTIFDDISTDGSNPDPDSDANPKNNSVGTPITFESIVTPPTNITPLGIAKAVDSTRNSDGSYNLKYTVIVKNYGTRELTDVQLSDSLSNVFGSSVFALNGKPTISANSELKIDTTFNGKTNMNLLLAGSKLAVGKTDTLTFTVAVANKDSVETTFSNTIYGSAKDSTATVTDRSNSGLNPDANANNNPGDDNAPTEIKLSGRRTPPTAIGEIPGGFSPNGDNINDNFIIEGINGTDRASKIYIYNRYGHLVYQNTDFGKETNGWDGKSNTGLRFGGDNQYVPSGTYYYCIEAEGVWDDKPKFGFITIVR